MGLYLKTISCVNCDEEFKSTYVKINAAKLDTIDKDGCNNYIGEYNPYLYQIFACPHCGFVFTPSFWVNNESRVNIKKEFIDKINGIQDYCGERSIEDAIFIWKLGLVSAQVSNQKTELLSGIALRIAWLYRYVENKESELFFIDKAMNGYIRAYNNDDLANNPMNIVNIIFQSAIKLKDLKVASTWLNELYKFRNNLMKSDMIIDAKEQFDNLKKELNAETNAKRLTK